MVRSGVAYRLIKDHIGSVRFVVNANTGAVAQELEYDPFGRVLADTDPGFQPFGFAGGLYDWDTELVRFGARDYDPLVGRWTAKDLIGFAGGQENVYVYAGGDPVNFVDPDGRKGGFVQFFRNFVRAWKDHVQPRHVSLTQYLHKSKFLARNRSSIARDAHQAVLRGERTLQDNGNVLYQWDTGRAIGTQGETVMRVVFDAEGRLVTSFPSHRVQGFFLTWLDVDQDGEFTPFDLFTLADPLGTLGEYRYLYDPEGT